jgi:hypothetical protein
MSMYVVVREAGPAWEPGGIFDQSGVAEHAAFMNGLGEAGFVLFAGPLAGSEAGRVRALLLIDAESEREIETRFAADPWVASGHLHTVSVEPWNVLVGTERLGALLARS